MPVCLIQFDAEPLDEAGGVAGVGTGELGASGFAASAFGASGFFAAAFLVVPDFAAAGFAVVDLALAGFGAGAGLAEAVDDAALAAFGAAGLRVAGFRAGLAALDEEAAALEVAVLFAAGFAVAPRALVFEVVLRAFEVARGFAAALPRVAGLRAVADFGVELFAAGLPLAPVPRALDAGFVPEKLSVISPTAVWAFFTRPWTLLSSPRESTVSLIRSHSVFSRFAIAAASSRLRFPVNWKLHCGRPSSNKK